MITSETISFLRSNLGAQLVAYIASETSTHAISEWAEGHAIPEAAIQERLHATEKLLQKLTRFDSPRTIQAWMQGSLTPNGPAPARILREGNEQDWELLLTASIL
jgi:hypothetical protein